VGFKKYFQSIAVQFTDMNSIDTESQQHVSSINGFVMDMVVSMHNSRVLQREFAAAEKGLVVYIC
jgi:16S rRNA C1402 N4-methylase RsmH